MQAFEDEDTRRSREVMSLDDTVDALNERVFRELLDHAGDNAESWARNVRLILVDRSLERIADHATKMGEEVLYLVEGADLRQQAERSS